MVVGTTVAILVPEGEAAGVITTLVEGVFVVEPPSLQAISSNIDTASSWSSGMDFSFIASLLRCTQFPMVLFAVRFSFSVVTHQRYAAWQGQISHRLHGAQKQALTVAG